MPRRTGRGDPEATARPERIGEILGPMLLAGGFRSKSSADVLNAVWGGIVGAELQKRTRVLGYNKGALEVAVDSSSLINDLQFHRAALLEDLQRQLRKPHIRRISFVLNVVQSAYDADGRHKG